MGPTESISRFIHDASLGDCPPQAVDKAKKVIADTFAAILAGAGSEVAPPLLRYLDANFRDRPSLFGSSRDEQWAIEDLELFARAVLAAPMMEVVHHRVAGGTVDAAMQSRCATSFAAAAAKLARALDGRTWLVGDRMSAADVTAAPVIHRVRSTKLFDAPELDALAPWVARVLAFDRQLG